MNEIWLFKSNAGILNKKSTFFNLYGNYDYLSEGYYKSVEFYIDGLNVHPTPEECLDAYIVGIAVEKAKKEGIDVPPCVISTSHTKIDHFPLLGYSMNPFSKISTIIESENELSYKMKTLTLSDKYFALLQKLPKADYRIDTVRIILGRTQIPEYKEIAQKIFKVFKIPLMKVKIIVTLDSYLFSAIEPLPYESLSINEKKLLEKMGKWQRR